LDTKTRSIKVGCGGTFISDVHILTAAHCVTNKNAKLILKEGKATFEDNSIIMDLSPSKIVVYPDWNYDFFEGNDVVVLTLSSPAPSELTRYGLDSDGSNDVTSVNNKAGYGRSGNGNEGDVKEFGPKRDGQNKYVAHADLMLTELGEQGFVPKSVLQYDFDNGLAANDAFGLFFELHDTGLGTLEVNSAQGDSGGPTINSEGKVTGSHHTD